MQKNTNRNWSRESCGQVRGTDRQTAQSEGEGLRLWAGAWV